MSDNLEAMSDEELDVIFAREAMGWTEVLDKRWGSVRSWLDKRGNVAAITTPTFTEDIDLVVRAYEALRIKVWSVMGVTIGRHSNPTYDVQIQPYSIHGHADNLARAMMLALIKRARVEVAAKERILG